MSENVPLLLDTDIGTNVDDALALAYLLRQPRCELLGITTVTGDVARRAACAEVICRAAGRDAVPIHCGAAKPLLFGPGQEAVPLYEAIRSRPHRIDRHTNAAVEFLRDTIHRRPGQITLITIGPLTNIAILFALDPQVPSLLRAIISMAGVYFPHEREVETNCRIDPIAAAMVFSARPPRHVCVGLDVTTRCLMPSAEVQRRFGATRPGPLTDMLDAWCSARPEVVFHDPLAAAVAFDAELCPFEPGRIAVDVDPRSAHCGRTRVTVSQNEPPVHHVASRVEPAEFFQEYFDVLGL